MSEEEKAEKVYSLVQKFLKAPPVIIWGSGATIPYGLPSMNELKAKLKPNLKDISENDNLEAALGKVDSSKIDEIKKIIKNEVLKRDKACLKKAMQDTNHLQAIIKMIEKFYEPHPRKIDIVTTNYDCVLEYALSKWNYNFTDGFTGRPLSKFDESTWGKKEIINLIKVHGSLNWFFYKDDEVIYLPYQCDSKELKKAIVLPTGNKYRETSQEPYRTLVSQSDKTISEAKSFLAIGFGFNDEHLTPKIERRIKDGTPIVILTKKATDSCTRKLRNANKYCLLEEVPKKETKVTFKETTGERENSVNLPEKLWQLDNFMEVL